MLELPLRLVSVNPPEVQTRVSQSPEEFHLTVELPPRIIVGSSTVTLTTGG